MILKELLALHEKAIKQKAKDAFAHVEKMKELLAKGQATQQMVDGATKTAQSLMDTEMKAREKDWYSKHEGSDWWELAKKQYPIEELSAGGYRVKSEAKQWKNDKEWEFNYKVQALEKIEKLVKWLDQGRKRGFGDKEADLEKFYAKYGHKDEVTESKKNDDIGWYVEKNGKNVEGPMKETEARKRVKELGGDAKGYEVGYVSDFEVHRSKG